MTCTPILKYFFANISYTYQHQNSKTYHQIDKENILNIYAGAKVFNRQAEVSITAFDLLDSYRNRIIQLKDNYTNYINRENFGPQDHQLQKLFQVQEEFQPLCEPLYRKRRNFPQALQNQDWKS